MLSNLGIINWREIIAKVDKLPPPSFRSVTSAAEDDFEQFLSY